MLIVFYSKIVINKRKWIFMHITTCNVVKKIIYSYVTSSWLSYIFTAAWSFQVWSNEWLKFDYHNSTNLGLRLQFKSFHHYLIVFFIHGIMTNNSLTTVKTQWSNNARTYMHKKAFVIVVLKKVNLVHTQDQEHWHKSCY